VFASHFIVFNWYESNRSAIEGMSLKLVTGSDVNFQLDGLSTNWTAPFEMGVFCDRLATRSDVQLFVDSSYVGVDGWNADFKAL
jgi:hypothetical protein